MSATCLLKNPKENALDDGATFGVQPHGSTAPRTRLSLYAETYEQAQKMRIAAANRTREDNDNTNLVELIEQLEAAGAKYLGREVKTHPLGPWLLSVRGIGPVLAGRLLARVDPVKFPSPGHLWSYAGLDGSGWRSRPHARRLTTLAYLIGVSFEHQSPLSGGYRDIYDARKAYERTRPACEKCGAAGLTSPETQGSPACRPIHIRNKARRYAVKRFLADFWERGGHRSPAHQTRSDPAAPEVAA